MVLNLQHELYFVLTIVLIQLLMPVRWGIVAQHVLENEGCSSRGWHCIGMECSLLKSVVFMPTWQGSLGTQCCIYLCLSLQIHFHFEIFLILFIDLKRFFSFTLKAILYILNLPTLYLRTELCLCIKRIKKAHIKTIINTTFWQCNDTQF